MSLPVRLRMRLVGLVHDTFAANMPDSTPTTATGITVEEVEAEIQKSIKVHLDGLREDGEVIPLGNAKWITSK